MSRSTPSTARHLLFLRHGETDANAMAIVQGQSHVPLNDVGVAQARRLALRLATYEPRIDVLVSSDLRRAMQTAEAIADATGLAIVADAGWRERGLGIMEGRPFGDLIEWRALHKQDTPPAGETRQAMAQRVRETLTRTLAQHAERRTVAIVSHGGTIQLVMRMLADGQLPLIDGHAAVDLSDVLNCSILHLTLCQDRWRVSCANDAAHLADMPPARGRPNPDAPPLARSSQV